MFVAGCARKKRLGSHETCGWRGKIGGGSVMFDVGSVSRREAVRQVLGRIALRCKDGGHGEQPLVVAVKLV